MFKLRKVSFSNHPILGNLALDFCDAQGNAVDTVLIAGENGAGKSTLLEALYLIASEQINFPIELELEDTASTPSTIVHPHFERNPPFWHTFINGKPVSGGSETSALQRNAISGIFSDVSINFTTKRLESVTSLGLDTHQKSYRSSTGFPNEIKQLIIDVQAQDDADVAHAARLNPEKPLQELNVQLRMTRFSNAFSTMFPDLHYDRIENKGGHKSIRFKKGNSDVPIEKLSSGEKQIVFRGCFLLKDINAMKGALVFIDEPEISLHPSWQMKIMDYYKGIFTDENGKQTSQIFAVTHSPFIIHNPNRRNDKVIVLARDPEGKIVVKSKPEYFNWASETPVLDAFSEAALAMASPTVYVEGKTDERYFNKAIEIYRLSNLPFQIKSIGGIDENGNDINSGTKNIHHAIRFFTAQKTGPKVGFVFDCDTNAEERSDEHIVVHRLPQYANGQSITKGVENALVLDGIDLSAFRRVKSEPDGYGGTRIIPEFDKDACSKMICSLPNDKLQVVFFNLKTALDELATKFSGEND